MSVKIDLVVLVYLLLVISVNASIDKETLRNVIPFRECLTQKFPGVCLKEKALDALNSTIMSDQPFILMDSIEIARNPDYKFTHEEDLPMELSARSTKLSNVLYQKIEDYFKSRVFKFNMSPAFEEEGRKKRGKKHGMMMMMVMGGTACMIAQLFMGKIAFMAGTALVLAKMAFVISTVIGLKKLSSGGGGGNEHVVYASEGHSHGGGGGGGWHRSWANDAQNLAYSAHITEESNGL